MTRVLGWHGESPKGKPRRRIFWRTLFLVLVLSSVPRFYAGLFFWMFPFGLVPVLGLGNIAPNAPAWVLLPAYALYLGLFIGFFRANRRVTVTIVYLILLVLLLANVVGCHLVWSAFSRLGT